MKYGKAALEIACSRGHASILTYLLPELICAKISFFDLQEMVANCLGSGQESLALEFFKLGIFPGPLEWCSLLANNRYEHVKSSIEHVQSTLNQMKEQFENREPCRNSFTAVWGNFFKPQNAAAPKREDTAPADLIKSSKEPQENKGIQIV